MVIGYCRFGVVKCVNSDVVLNKSSFLLPSHIDVISSEIWLHLFSFRWFVVSFVPSYSSFLVHRNLTCSLLDLLTKLSKFFVCVNWLSGLEVSE